MSDEQYIYLLPTNESQPSKFILTEEMVNEMFLQNGYLKSYLTSNSFLAHGHRLDGPALSIKDKNGSTFQCYLKKGKKHNPIGPADIQIKSGGDKYLEYWFNGKEYFNKKVYGGERRNPRIEDVTMWVIDSLADDPSNLAVLLTDEDEMIRSVAQKIGKIVGQKD